MKIKRNKKKRKERKLKVYKNRRDIRGFLIWTIYCIFCFGWIIIIPVSRKLLKCYGLQTEAIVTAREDAPNYRRWSNINYYIFEFTAENGKVYEGSSMIEVGNTDSIGKKIKIYYFSFYPDFNLRKE
jgi:hypothetical protein